MTSPTRRDVLMTAGACAGAAMLGPVMLNSSVRAQDSAHKIPVPTPAQLRWQNCEIGAIFHLDMPVVAGDTAPNNSTKETFDPKLYNPVDLDTDQWIAAAKSAGARYAIFTATHFNGFMQWQSDAYPYGLKQAAWRDGRGDIVGDFVRSCRNADILPGIYLSTHRNAYQTVWGHYVDWGKGKGTAKQAAYNRIAEQQTRELCSRYGPLVQIWYDAGVKLPDEGGPDVLPIFDRFQPDSVFYNSSKRSDHRWIGNEDGRAAYPCWATMPGLESGAVSHNSGVWRKCLAGGDADGSVWSPGMADIVLRGRGNHDWFWRPGKEDTQLTVDQLMSIYDTSAGRNCNLIIGVVVNNRGLVPGPDVVRLGEFGKAMDKRFGKPVDGTAGKGNTIDLVLDHPVKIDQIVIQEDIAHGERIRAYEVHGQTASNSWTRLASGQSIGHKRVERFDPVEVWKLRLSTGKSQAPPIVKRFDAYSATS